MNNNKTCLMYKLVLAISYINQLWLIEKEVNLKGINFIRKEKYIK